MISIKQSVISVALLTGLSTVSSVQAATYAFNIDNPYGSAGAGKITNISTSYNSDTNRLTWSSSLTSSISNMANGFWLVLSDGANPKNHVNEYAILYGDLSTGSITSYVYNGVNSSNSWNTPGELIQSFDNAITTNAFASNPASVDLSFSFSIDASALNNYTPTTPGTNDWDGVKYAQNIGVWYHPVIFDNTPTYNPDGSLASFSYSKSGWYDTGDQTTTDVTDVPEPGTLALSMIGLVGMMAVRRRQKKQS